MSTILYENAAADSQQYNLQVGNTVRSMRRNLGVTVDQLARASGIPAPSIAAIERGGATTRAQRHDIATAVGWLSNNSIAKGLGRSTRGARDIEG